MNYGIEQSERGFTFAIPGADSVSGSYATLEQAEADAQTYAREAQKIADAIAVLRQTAGLPPLTDGALRRLVFVPVVASEMDEAALEESVLAFVESDPGCNW